MYIEKHGQQNIKTTCYSNKQNIYFDIELLIRRILASSATDMPENFADVSSARPLGSWKVES